MISRTAIGSLALATVASLPVLLGEGARAQGLEPGPGELPPTFEPSVGCGKACAFHAAMGAGYTPGQLIPGARFAPRGPGDSTDPTNVLHNNLAIEILSVDINAQTASITGTNVMTIVSNVANLSTFTFSLRCNYTVTNCTITDTIGSYSVTPTVPSCSPVTSYARVITFTRPINLGDTFTISISYNGTAISGLGLGSFYAGTQNAVAGAPTAVCTLSEPYYAGTWWPCKDGDVSTEGDNSDKATLDCAITAADTFQSVSNGLLVGVDTLSGNRKRYRWSTSYPLSTYLVFFSTSQYNQWSVNYAYAGGSMPVQFSIYPSLDNSTNRGKWELVPTMLATYEPMYGLYPFVNEKYGIYQFEFSGGQEHQTYTGQGRSAAFDERITSHELGHQWWGDNITCKTWSDIWLNEGFATYTEALWAERKPGSTGFAALHAMMIDSNHKPSASSLASADSIVYVPTADISSASRIFSGSYTYEKAGWVLHMLRHIIGDTTFFNALQTYRAAKQGGAATTSDFTSIVSGVAGRDLSWFFNPWLYQPGAPAYSFAWAGATINGQAYLRLSVAQTQTSPLPLFTMPLDVQITTVTGTVSTTVASHSALDDFLIPLASPVSTDITAVVLDPSDWVLNTAKAGHPGAYVQGPPKIVALSPVPGASIALASSPTALSIVFSDPVTITAANVGITRGATSIPFTFAYSSTNSTATLTFASPLSAGTYNVAISDAIVATANSKHLDGELATNTAAALPSGDGVALGSATYTFTITAPPCAVDFNHSGGVEVQDIFDFLNAWFAGNPQADFNGNGLSVSDIFDFLNAWFVGC